MAASELSYREPLVGKQSSVHIGPRFLAVKLISQSVVPTVGQEL